MRDIKANSSQRHHMWMQMLLLVALWPGSLQSSERQKRQIRFPGNNNGDRAVAARPCVTPDRRAGTCIPLSSCAVFRRVNNINRLRRFFCGFDGDEPRVCCPQPSTPNRSIETTSTTRSTTPPTRRTTPPTRRTTRTTRRTTTRGSSTSRTTTTTTERPLTGNRIATGEGTMPSFLPERCGKSKYLKSRIIGGVEAIKGSWPWMAVVYQEKRGTKSPDCGGALVTNQHVVTAAHCVVGRRATTLNANVLSVRLGEHDLYSNADEMNPVDVDVATVTKHENFNPSTYANDIAVLKLVRPVDFNDNISAICLPYDSPLTDQDLTDYKAFVAGWGTTAFNGPSSPVLREAAFEIQDQTLCREVYKNDLPITDVYLCAGTLDGSKDSCQGDSGGPLMCIGTQKRYYLMGIVSFGKLCATPGYPGVYTRVTKYLDWLQTQLTS